MALVSSIARIGSCGSPTFSPDGAHLAFVCDMSGLPQVWSVPATSGWPALLTAIDDPVRSVLWSPNGRWIAFTAAPGGGMHPQLFVVRPDGTGLRRLSDGPPVDNHLDRWTHDGQLAITANRERVDAYATYLVDPATAAWHRIAETEGTAQVLDTSEDGRRALLGRLRQRGDSDVWLLDLEAGEERHLTPHQGQSTCTDAWFSAAGDAVHLVSDDGRDRHALVRLALDGGEIEVVAERADAELEAAVPTPDATRAALLWNLAGRSEVELLDLATGDRRAISELPGERVRELTWRRDGAALALVAGGATSPFDVWTLDVATGRFTPVTHSPHAGVDLAGLIRPELVRWAAHDGLELSGWLYRAPGAHVAGRLVLSFHGGPESQERPVLNATYQALLAEGVSVLAPNVRGSSGFGKRFVHLDDGPLRHDAVRDIQSTAAFAIGAGLTAPGRIGITGGSYGGYMTIAGLTAYPELFGAGAYLFGIVNFETFFAHTEPWMAAISKAEYGDPDTQRDLLRELSPIHRLDRVTAPTLVIHGANDTNCPLTEATQVVERLRERDVPVEYILFPDEGHGFQRAPNRVRAAEAIVGWFVRHLGDGAHD
jgi:dipeptidyl aminopeptidase/acylaminoacyl peptidase